MSVKGCWFSYILFRDNTLIVDMNQNVIANYSATYIHKTCVYKHVQSFTYKRNRIILLKILTSNCESKINHLSIEMNLELGWRRT